MQNLTFKYFPILDSRARILPQSAYTWETIVTEKVVVKTEKCVFLSQQMFVWVPVLLMWETEKSVEQYFILPASRNKFSSRKYKTTK